MIQKRRRKKHQSKAKSQELGSNFDCTTVNEGKFYINQAFRTKVAVTI